MSKTISTTPRFANSYRRRLSVLGIAIALSGCGGGATSKEDSPAKPALSDATAAAATHESVSPALAPTNTSPPAAPPIEAAHAAPVKAKPVVYGAAELAKILDFTKLKLPEGTEVFELAPARADFKTPGTVKTVWPAYMAQFSELGWKSTGGPREQITDDYASATLAKDNFEAEVSISKMGDKPETMVSLLWHGNLDSRKLPRVEGAKAIFESQSGTGYTTEKNVADTHAELIKLLIADGWFPYSRLSREGAETADKENRFAKLMKQGYDLDVMVGVAPAQKNKTMVQYNVYALSHEIPVPGGATNIEFDDNKWELQCKAPDDFKTVADMYAKAMLAAGYSSLPSEKPQENYWNQRFGKEAGDIVLVQTSRKDDQTHILVTGISAAMIKEMKNHAKEAAEKENAKAAEEQKEAQKLAEDQEKAAAKIKQQQDDIEKQIQDKIKDALNKVK